MHYVKVGERAMVGNRAVLESEVVVENDAIIAPGSIVPAGSLVKAKEYWAGSPAKKERDVTPEEIEEIVSTCKIFIIYLFLTFNS